LPFGLAWGFSPTPNAITQKRALAPAFILPKAQKQKSSPTTQLHPEKQHKTNRFHPKTHFAD
jgi:hypothetical protein